jgi:hypothetical protein
MRSFAFLTDKHVIVGALQTSTIKPSVLVMNFKEANPESVHLDDAEYQASFEIPKFRSQTNLSNISIRTDPAPTWMPHPDLQVPFFSARNGRLYVLELWLEYGRPMDLVIPSSTLISRLDDNRILEQIPWEDWGPTGTRMMLLPRHSHTWVCYVFGTKFVIKKQFRQTTYLQVYDFNQLALQQALRSGDAPSDTTAFEVRTSTVPVHGVFLNDVHTSLPYRIKTVHLQIDPGHDLMCSEDSLVIVEVRSLGYAVLSG